MADLSRTIVVSLAAALCVTLAGCSAAVSTDPTDPGRVSATSNSPAEPSAPVESVEATQPAPPPASEPADQAGALEAYVAAEARQLPKLKQQYSDTYSDIAIEAVQPDMIAFTYTYSGAVDKKQAVTHFDSMIPEFEKAAKEQIFPLMAQYGVSPTQGLRYTYLAADGSTIWTHDFSSN